MRKPRRPVVKSVQILPTYSTATTTMAAGSISLGASLSVESAAALSRATNTVQIDLLPSNETLTRGSFNYPVTTNTLAQAPQLTAGGTLTLNGNSLNPFNPANITTGTVPVISRSLNAAQFQVPARIELTVPKLINIFTGRVIRPNLNTLNSGATTLTLAATTNNSTVLDVNSLNLSSSLNKVGAGTLTLSGGALNLPPLVQSGTGTTPTTGSLIPTTGSGLITQTSGTGMLTINSGTLNLSSGFFNGSALAPRPSAPGVIGILEGGGLDLSRSGITDVQLTIATGDLVNGAGSLVVTLPSGGKVTLASATLTDGRLAVSGKPVLLGETALIVKWNDQTLAATASGISTAVVTLTPVTAPGIANSALELTPAIFSSGTADPFTELLSAEAPVATSNPGGATFSIQPVPEPSTALLAALGASGLLARRRR